MNKMMMIIQKIWLVWTTCLYLLLFMLLLVFQLRILKIMQQ